MPVFRVAFKCFKDARKTLNFTVNNNFKKSLTFSTRTHQENPRKNYCEFINIRREVFEH